MNIMKTNMLLLDNKIMKEEPSNAPVVEAPVPSKVKNYSGMNALAFQGMQNLMANPALATKVGVMMSEPSEKDDSAKSYVAPFSSNIAFQGGKTKTFAVAAALAATAAAGLTSCDRETSQYQNVQIDMSALVSALNANMARLEARIEALQKQLADQDAAHAERDAAMLKVLQAAYNQLLVISANLQTQNASLEDFKAMVYTQNSAILEAIALVNNTTKEEARAAVEKILQALENHFIDEKEAIAQIQALLLTNNELLGEIVSILKDLKASADEAKVQRDSLMSIANDIKSEVIKNGKVSAYQRQVMIAQLGYTIQQNNAQIANQKAIIKAINSTGASLNATIQEVAAELGVKVDYLAEVISITGASIEQVMNMSKEEILEVLNTYNAQLEEVNNNLINVNVNINSNTENNTEAIEKAADEIMNILNKISDQIDALSKQFGDAVNMFRNKLNALIRFAQGIYSNGVTTNIQLDSLNKQIFDLAKDVKSIKNTAIQIKNNLENGYAIDVNLDTSKIEELLEALDLHQQASKDEIIAKLNKFIKGQENIEIAINKLGDENSSNLTKIANLILNKTNDNSDVIDAINNLSKSNEENIAAATEELAAKLDKLIAKVDKILDKMDDNAALLVNYFNQVLDKLDPMQDILDAIKANGAKIDVTNMKLDELKAELEKLKPELEKLNASAKEANTYLDIIAKRQLEIKEQIANLEAIGGNGLSKAELEELWQQHDAAGFAKFKEYLDGLHAEDMDKADEIIENMKKGNKIAQDTYNWLLEYAEAQDLNQEQLRDLIQKIYDYLPELICKCTCGEHVQQDEQTHEGIIGTITARKR